MTKEDKTKWAVQAYNNGEKVRHIAEALNISVPTLYRYITPHITPRKPEKWSTEDTPNAVRSEACRYAWTKRGPMRARLEKNKDLSLLDLLSRFGLSLTLDVSGHALVHHTRPGRLFLTDIEFRQLTKTPVQALKQIAPRINATFGGDV